MSKSWLQINNFLGKLLGRCSSVRLTNTRLLSIWTGANEAVGNMKLFNNHSGLRDLPCFAQGIYWATGLSLTTPFTEGRPGVNDAASPPGHHQEQAPKQRCTFRPTTFSSVQMSVGAALSARARGSGAANNPTWQPFTPAWHVPLWSNNFLAIRSL